MMSNNILGRSYEHEIVYNGPIVSNPTSPFVKNTVADNIPEYMIIHGKEKMSNIFVWQQQLLPRIVGCCGNFEGAVEQKPI